jgi:acetyltransferase-like isoleucine patch superfamily enzyme
LVFWISPSVPITPTLFHSPLAIIAAFAASSAIDRARPLTVYQTSYAIVATVWNAIVSGFTKVGNNNMFGVNSATIPTIEIGDNNTIAAGMIITKTVKDNETHFYRFKEKVVIT